MERLILVIAAFIISLLITPLVRKGAVLIKVIDVPRDKRRVHKKPTPLLGGIAIYVAFMSVLILKKGVITNSEIAIMLGATVIAIGGFLDDKFDIKPWQKLAFQIVATVIVLAFGLKIEILTNPFSDNNPFINIELLAIPITILWVVGITNAFNLIDGLDGLSAGVALISSATIFIIAILNNRMEAATLTLILCGAIGGFLPYNFNPASIFMGDTGAQLLGFLLATISIEGAIKSATAFALAVPILTLGLPIYDTIFAMIRRKVNGKPMMQADRGHLHHRLLDMGLTQKQTVIIMYLISMILGGISIIAMQLSSTKSYFLLAGVLLIIVALAWKCGFFKKRE